MKEEDESLKVRNSGKLYEFLAHTCPGARYDHCDGSTCPFGSADGCTHPLYPVDDMIAQERARMDAGDTIWMHKGRTYIVSTPFWITHAYTRPDGAITIARSDAIQIDPPVKVRTMMLDLTEEELLQHPLPVDGDLPATNRTDHAVSYEEVWRRIALLQNEGYEGEEEIVDRTPYQKGDAGDRYCV